MKKTLIKILLVISPFLVMYGAAGLNKDGGSLAWGIGIWMSILIGIPFVGITGLILEYFLSKKQSNPERFSIISYLIPASVTWIYVFIMLVG